MIGAATLLGLLAMHGLGADHDVAMPATVGHMVVISQDAAAGLNPDPGARPEAAVGRPPMSVHALCVATVPAASPAQFATTAAGPELANAMSSDATRVRAWATDTLTSEVVHQQNVTGAGPCAAS